MDIGDLAVLGYRLNDGRQSYRAVARNAILSNLDYLILRVGWPVHPGDEYLAVNGKWTLRKSKGLVRSTGLIHRRRRCPCKIRNICPYCPKSPT